MTDRTPSLSVVVPFYGVEDYLAECLDSILAQTMTDFEVIAVDDGSLDGSLTIAQRYAARDPRITIVRQPNGGLGPARNTGVRHARGRYLMFVDSDDLLAPRAFETLVGSLERTGSDVACANAWRFTRERGTWPSWTHQVPFAGTRLRTNVREFPALVRDRMAWNKVYRRTFWDAGGYEFPAIRYEDYPVTLRAHLDAAAVDVLAERLYLWRDRESGTSITQQSKEATNALDRAASANRVLDLLGADVPGDVVEAVHAYLIDIDLVAVAGALAHADPEGAPAVERAARALASRLRRQRPPAVTPVAALLQRALSEGDLALVRGVVAWREHGDRRRLLGELVGHARPYQVALAARAVTDRRRSVGRVWPRRLESELVDAVVEAGTLVLNVRSKLRAQFAFYAKAGATLRCGRRSVDLVLEKRARGAGLALRIIVTPDDVLSVLGQGRPDAVATVELTAEVGPLRWAGALACPDPDPLPPVLDLGAGRWAVTGMVGEASPDVGVRLASGVLVAEAQKTDDGFVLTLNRPEAELVLRRPGSSGDLVASASDGVVRWDADALLRDDPPDDPVTGAATRLVEAPGLGDGRLYLARRPGVVRRDGVTLKLAPSRDGWAELTRSR